MRIIFTKIVIGLIVFAISISMSSDAYGQSELSGNLTVTANEISTFRVSGASNLNGLVKIISTQTAEIEVIFTKKARASSRSEEKRFLNLIDLRLGPIANDRIELTIISPSHAPWEGTNHQVLLEVVVRLPEKMLIQGRGKFIDYDISGPFNGIDIDSEHSAVKASRIFGPVDIKTTEENIYLDAIKGSIFVETIHGDINSSDIIVSSGYAVFTTEQGSINLDNILGSVEAYTSHAEINAQDIDASDGSIVLRTDYSPVTVKRVFGELICETNHSPIVIKGFVLKHGESKIKTSYSPINVEIAEILESDIYIENNYENITLELPILSSTRLIGSINRGGQIQASNLDVLPTILEPDRLEATLHGGVSRIEVKVTGVGDILFEGY